MGNAAYNHEKVDFLKQHDDNNNWNGSTVERSLDNIFKDPQGKNDIVVQEQEQDHGSYDEEEDSIVLIVIWTLHLHPNTKANQEGQNQEKRPLP